MRDNGVELDKLAPLDVDSFLHRPTGRSLKKPALRKYRRYTLQYLDWLHAQGRLGFDPRKLPGRRQPLPPMADNFVRTLEPVLKPATLKTYRTSLGRFHFWLGREQVLLAELDRQHLVAGLGWMHRRGLYACTRLKAILHVRAYLRWLHEYGEPRIPADVLVRVGDFPKQPQYLPRPLEPETDRELQRRLRTSQCHYQLGLLLMRHTGLRVGELMALPHDCLRVDPKGNRFLKVPLGKLDNERLVPLDDETTKLLTKLRRRGRRGREYLLETSKRNKTYYSLLRRVLSETCEGLRESEPITSHRLRHTYATSLLAGGMSLVGIMKLLGHRDYRMTLRYTAITDETITIEYHAALARNERRYGALLHKRDSTDADPLKMLADVVRCIQKHEPAGDTGWRKVRTLVKRLRRVRSDLRSLLGRPPR
jgi:site-specific recombinase XerD